MKHVTTFDTKIDPTTLTPYHMELLLQKLKMERGLSNMSFKWSFKYYILAFSFFKIDVFFLIFKEIF